MDILSECASIYHMCDCVPVEVWRGHQIPCKESPMAVSHHAGVGNLTLVLSKSKCSRLLSRLSSHCHFCMESIQNSCSLLCVYTSLHVGAPRPLFHCTIGNFADACFGISE